MIGYFAMPILAGGQILGSVDPGREGTTLVAKRVTLHDAKSVDDVARALVEAASWVGCDEVRNERGAPAKLRSPLIAAVTRAG